MTDLEMTRLCAEAMGFVNENARNDEIFEAWASGIVTGTPYDPLHDNAQAMALLKRFAFSIDKNPEWLGKEYYVAVSHGVYVGSGRDADLNRAIVAAAAKMQAMRTK